VCFWEITRRLAFFFPLTFKKPPVFLLLVPFIFLPLTCQFLPPHFSFRSFRVNIHDDDDVVVVSLFLIPEMAKIEPFLPAAGCSFLAPIHGSAF
jgi:hypothetical protein